MGGRSSLAGSTVSGLISRACSAASGAFFLHRFLPENFLCVCSSAAACEALMAAGVIQGTGFSLRFSRWNRQLRATLRPFRYRVHVELVGVLSHAWSLNTADFILGSSCWVERIATTNESREDLRTLSVIVWSDDPEKIAREFLLGIPEPPPPYEMDELCIPQRQLVPEAVSVLDYPVVVHLSQVEDHEAASDDSSMDNGFHSSGEDSDDRRRFDSSRRSRSHTFACRRGVVDGACRGSGLGAGGGASGPGARAPPSVTCAAGATDWWARRRQFLWSRIWLLIASTHRPTLLLLLLLIQ